jgi:hypothetical protein
MVGWVPVAGQKNRKTATLKPLNIVHEDKKNIITTVDLERSTWQEIILNIGDEQRIMSCEGYHERIAINLGNLMSC